MATGGAPVEQLRGYLLQLPPAKRALLIAELERALLRGDDVPGGDLLLQEVRSSVRESGKEAPRISPPARLFFRPLHPFLIDEASVQQPQARIARTSLQPLWDWICRDVVPDVGHRFSEAIMRELEANSASPCDQFIRPFQEQVTARIRAMLDGIKIDERVRRRMVGQIGTPAALEDAKNLATILSGRDVFAAMAGRLPGHIVNLADAQLTQVKAVVDSCLAHPDRLLPFALVLVMGRLASPWQLVRLAVAHADRDDAARIAGTPYAVAVTMTLADIERMVEELKVDLKAGRSLAVTALLKCIHDAVRGVRSELDLAGDSPWGRQLAGIRSEVASALRTEIEAVPGRVRRLLRPRPAGKPAGGLDQTEVTETEALIELLGACRHYASELAVSEVALRAHGEVQQYLDTTTRTLVESLRGGEAADRPFRQSQVDAAVRFCAKVFGREYAAVLGKAADVAANSERKTAAKT
jgi:hypothetical protein